MRRFGLTILAFSLNGEVCRRIRVTEPTVVSSSSVNHFSRVCLHLKVEILLYHIFIIPYDIGLFSNYNSIMSIRQ